VSRCDQHADGRGRERGGREKSRSIFPSQKGGKGHEEKGKEGGEKKPASAAGLTSPLHR